MASVRDVLVICVILFAFGMLAFIVNFIAHTMIASIVAIPTINASTNAVTAFNATATVTDRFDYLFFGLFIGLFLAIIVSGYLVGGRPLFMGIYMLVVGFAIILSMFLANAWDDIANMSIFGNTIAAFPVANHILTNLPYYALFAGIIGCLAMFAKPYFGGGGNA